MKINFNKINKTKCLTAIGIIIFLIIIMSITSKSEKYPDLTVMLDNEEIETLIKPEIDEDGNIFFSESDVKNLFDDTIFYNDINEELITTYNKHVALLKVGSETGTINDEEVSLKGKLKIENGTIYLPISDLADVYDIEVFYSHKSNRIVIDSLNKEKSEVIVKQRTGLKKSKGLFGKKIETLIIGDKLMVLEDLGKYKKVRSSTGNIGYVKTKKVSEAKKIRDSVTYQKIELTPYFNYSNSSGIYDNIEVDKSKRNVVLPTFFILEDESKVLDKTNINTATYSIYKKWAETNSLEILPTLVNDANVSDTLITYNQRTDVINHVKNKIVEYGFFGINIDYKTIDDYNSFYRFIIELVPRFRAADLKVIVTINNNNIDRSKIEKIVDCIIEE